MKTLHVAWAVTFALLAGTAPHVPSPLPAPLPLLRSDRSATSIRVAAPVVHVAAAMPEILPAPGAVSGAEGAPGAAAAKVSPALPVSGFFEADLEAMRLYRPGYEFWHHVYTVPNGQLAFGSATDGRLLATLPLGGSTRREETRLLLEEAAEPVVYHSTRGSFVAEGTQRFGSFLAEWGEIFERFGVPAEVGLAQALVESGLKGRVRSEADAVGFCQWLPENWARLQALSPHVIEVSNQTTQASYCAAHLAILATKYGSLIPALSEHHAGRINVGRTIINGSYAGGDDVRDRYFLGADVTLLIRQIRESGYREVVGSYGPRSFRYAEMVFGNLRTISELERKMPQERIFAMRPDRPVALDEVVARTGLSADEIRRFNPALVNRVPVGANLYLPHPIDDLGSDTTFWHRAPTQAYLDALNVFLQLAARFGVEDWNDGTIFGELRTIEDRFRATATEEGTVMATMLAYVVEDLSDARQRELLAEFPKSEQARRLLEDGVDRLQVLVQLFDGDGRDRLNRSVFLATASLNIF